MGRYGRRVRVEVVLTNRSKEPPHLQQRFNVYDYWPFLTFTVTRPDGTTATLVKPVAAFKREDYIGEQVLEPGESYVHAARLDQWPDPRKMSEDLGPLFGEPGRYTVRAVYAVPGRFRNRHPKARRPGPAGRCVDGGRARVSGAIRGLRGERRRT